MFYSKPTSLSFFLGVATDQLTVQNIYNSLKSI